MSTIQKTTTFDPNGVSLTNGNFCGLPVSAENTKTVIIPAPWDLTTSYRDGTANAPQAILNASYQLDLEDPNLPKAWENGINMLPISEQIKEINDTLRQKVKKYIVDLERGMSPTENNSLKEIATEVNKMSVLTNDWIQNKIAEVINNGQLPALLGGDHSCSLGSIKAVALNHEAFGILQFDAHADLREAYQGFEFSHASVMFNALKLNEVSSLTQVGIRDLCEEESNRIINSNGKIVSHFDWSIKERIFNGDSFNSICDYIVEPLPQKVYVSFDIDVLQPQLCPNTGTPVPGGLSFDESLYLVKKVVDSGRQIIGCDLCEVGYSEGKSAIDANVGARILYRLINLMVKSNGIG